MIGVVSLPRAVRRTKNVSAGSRNTRSPLGADEALWVRSQFARVASEQASSIEARAGEKVVRIGFSNSYRGTADDSAILGVTGEKGVRFFK